jgi:pyruvate/2-oxoglutarate dehydrogenase complex dihydrolipoamide dehydrogenase (E3) component
LPTQLSEHTTETLHSQGIEFHLNTHISSMSLISNKDKIGAKIALKTTPNTSNNSHHSEHLCDHLIIATGSEPRIELAEKSSIPLDNVS